MGQSQRNPRNLNRDFNLYEYKRKFLRDFDSYNFCFFSGRMGIGLNLDIKRRANREILKDRKEAILVQSNLCPIVSRDHTARISATLNKY